jgi:hypothetical protein
MSEELKDLDEAEMDEETQEKVKRLRELAAEESEASAPKKKPKKKFIIMGSVAAVLIIAIVGGLAWHEQPSFCNAICHTPMDPYVESFDTNTSVVAAQADLTTQLSVTTHKESEQNLECLDCHVPSIGEQISEGMKWVTGDYTVPLAEMEYDGEEFCLRSGCHVDINSKDDLKPLLAAQERNPHNNHQSSGLDCADCHKTHEQSVMQCTQCHSDAEVPEGWVTYSAYTAQHKTAK